MIEPIAKLWISFPELVLFISKPGTEQYMEDLSFETIVEANEEQILLAVQDSLDGPVEIEIYSIMDKDVPAPDWGEEIYSMLFPLKNYSVDIDDNTISIGYGNELFLRLFVDNTEAPAHVVLAFTVDDNEDDLD